MEHNKGMVGAGNMKIMTTRFGELEIDASRIIEMRGCGILGFEHLRRFLMMMHSEKTPLVWFQSLDDGAVAFVLANPFLIKPDYQPEISAHDVGMLEIVNPEDALLMSIMTFRSIPMTVSANFRAPLVINAVKRLAMQVVLDDQDYPIRYVLQKNNVLAEEGVGMNEKEWSNLRKLSQAGAA
jgi:flagellar assembly factor FliW